MTTKMFQNHTALVTGASSGIGADLARELAAHGANLVLVARRVERLEELRQQIERDFGVAVHCLPADLSSAEARDALPARVAEQGLSIDILINNAGLGVYGEFRDVAWEATENMLQLDIVALTHLTRLFVDGMVSRGRGYIMQIASTGAFQPSPTYAAYAAAKAYVLSFGHALHFELRGSGVSCTTVCPGVTATEFFDVSGQKKTWFHRLTIMSSTAVARLAVKRMAARRPEIVTGWMNAMTAFSMRFLPRPLMSWLAFWVMRND